jgi:phosphoserine phosphatase
MARKGHGEIGASRLAALAAVLPGAGAPNWLDPGQAVDLTFSAAPDDLPALRAALGEVLEGAAMDAVLQRAAGRRKRLLLADMDSTMIHQECIDELADFAGLKAEVAGITERAMRGEIAFAPALRERVALLRGLPVETVDRVLAERITLVPGGTALVRTMRAHGGYCALVSGGFTLFTDAVAAQIGFDEHRSNTLEVDGDRLAGTVAEPILGREAKRDRLVALRETLALPRSATMAVGDGANDLDMLGEAGLGIAFRAKPAVAAAAHARIDHNDLDALLFVQGYARSEFAH